MIICSISYVLKSGSLSAVGILSKVLGIDTFQQSKVFVNSDTLVEIMGHLFALWYLVGSQQSVVIQTLSIGSFIRQTRQFLVSLLYKLYTRYSWNSKGTYLHLLR